jgi:hypothetical protein
MNYTVNWTDEAQFSLAAVWMRAVDRWAVTAAQTTVDRLLATDPLRNGTHVSEGLYALEVDPLRVQFEVSEGNRVVTVVSVRLLS